MLLRAPHFHIWRPWPMGGGWDVLDASVATATLILLLYPISYKGQRKERNGHDDWVIHEMRFLGIEI